MNISMAMVFDELCRFFECSKGPFYNPHYRVERARLAQEDVGDAVDQDTCYIVDSEADHWLPGVSSEGIICMGHGVATGAPCAFTVEGASSLAAIRNAASQAIARYENWANNLIDLSLHGAGLEELVDSAHGLFMNPITIIDENYRILAQTDSDYMDDVLWVSNNSGSSEQLVIEILATEAEEVGFTQYLADLRSRGCLKDYETNIGKHVNSCLVKSNSEELVSVNIIEKNRAVTDGDFDCLKFFARIVSAKLKAIEYTWQDSSGSYIALLHDVVRGNLSDASEFKARLDRNWINVLSNFTVAVLAAPQGFLRYFQLCRIEDDLSELIPEGKGVINSRTLVLFINHEGQLPSAIMDTLKRYARANDLAVGVSESRGDDCSLRDLVNQARHALKIRKRAFQERALVEYRECRKYYLYEICSQQKEWGKYLHPSLKIIREYDERNSPPLAPTLFCLIENGGNRTLTAKILGIQRNALQYRLGKIEDICSIDLSDPEVYDHLSFSIKLEQYCSGSIGAQ